MGTRIIAAVVGLAIVIPALGWGGVLAVLILAGIVLLIGLDEYAGMAVPEARGRSRALLFVCGGAIFFTSAMGPPELVVPVTGLALAVGMVVPMIVEADVAVAARQAVRLGFGLVYVPLMLSPLIHIRRQEEGIALVVLLLAATWLGDTGAYFAGRVAGKTPLFPRVSPKKTWEGFWGGLILSVIGVGVIKAVSGLSLSWPLVLVLGAVLDIAGVLGDLAESMLKRAFGVKDSGWIMPGHGGILDRIDSLLFTAPLLWCVLELQRIFGM